MAINNVRAERASMYTCVGVRGCVCVSRKREREEALANARKERENFSLGLALPRFARFRPIDRSWLLSSKPPCLPPPSASLVYLEFFEADAEIESVATSLSLSHCRSLFLLYLLLSALNIAVIFTYLLSFISLFPHLYFLPSYMLYYICRARAAFSLRVFYSSLKVSPHSRSTISLKFRSIHKFLIEILTRLIFLYFIS